MIKDWRAQWKQDFPFLFVQLANFMKPSEEPAESAWAELREAQSMTLSLPKTGMAVIIDVGEANDIHPRNKLDVGNRLALAAQKVAYGDKAVFSGPTYASMKTEGNKIRLTFNNVGGGLVARGGALKEFAIAGPDKKFVWADARIEGNTIVISHSSVQNPVAVRYAWANNPQQANLYNKEGLPASPFRTDDWPGLTISKK
jgi:sialate O-acetylesterase